MFKESVFTSRYSQARVHYAAVINMKFTQIESGLRKVTSASAVSSVVGSVEGHFAKFQGRAGSE